MAAIFLLLLTFVFGRASAAVTSRAPVPDHLEIMFGQLGETSTTLARVDDSLQVRRLYATLLTLPDFPERGLYCPNDTGQVYTLRFRQGDRLVLEAAVRATGCQQVMVLHGPTLWAGSPEPSTFWDQLKALTE